MSAAKKAALAQEILKTLSRAYRKTKLLSGEGLIEQMIYILLNKWFPSAKAESILRTLQENFVDLNEVRVCHVTEIEAALDASGLPDEHEAAQGVKDLLTGYHLLRNDLEVEYYQSLSTEEKISFLKGIPVLEPFMIHYILLSADPEGTAQYQVDLARVAQRAALIPRTSSPRKVTAALEGLDLGADLLPLQLHLIRLGTEVCESRTYDCMACKLMKVCATGVRAFEQAEAKKKAKKTPPKEPGAAKSKTGKTAKRSSRRPAKKKTTKSSRKKKSDSAAAKS